MYVRIFLLEYRIHMDIGNSKNYLGLISMFTDFGVTSWYVGLKHMTIYGSQVWEVLECLELSEYGMQRMKFQK